MSEKSISNHTLYLIQASYASSPLALAKLRQIFSSGDAAIFMGEAVLYAQNEAAQYLSNCYVLDTELPLLKAGTANIQIINYSDFATLCLQFNRCITLK